MRRRVVARADGDLAGEGEAIDAERSRATKPGRRRIGREGEGERHAPRLPVPTYPHPIYSPSMYDPNLAHSRKAPITLHLGSVYEREIYGLYGDKGVTMEHLLHRPHFCDRVCDKDNQLT